MTHTSPVSDEAVENPGLKIGWVCFHCWEFFPPTFAGQRDAQAHFGGSEIREPACQISKRDHGLLLHVRALELERAELRGVLDAIRQYGSDTLSGRVDGGPDDRDWQRAAVLEMTRRARAAPPSTQEEKAG